MNILEKFGIRKDKISKDNIMVTQPPKTGILSMGFNKGQYNSPKLANLQNTLRNPPTFRAPVVQSPSRLTVRVPSSDKFLINSSGTAITNVRSIDNAGRR